MERTQTTVKSTTDLKGRSLLSSYCRKHIAREEAKGVDKIEISANPFDEYFPEEGFESIRFVFIKDNFVKHVCEFDLADESIKKIIENN